MSLTSHYDREAAKNFLQHKNRPNLSFLIYRDLESLLREYLPQGRALDFGCGPGLSTRFLSSLGYEVIGVDINKNMLEQAMSEPDGTPFAWIEHAKTPFASASFDLVLSVMVLLEMPNLKTMQEAVDEISRLVRPGGIFLAVVGSENFHKYNWFDKTTFDLEKCQNLNSGDVFVTHSKVTDIIFKDYFYTTENYVNVFEQSKFTIVKIHRALGLAEDNMPWGIEKSFNPFTHFVCQKEAL